MAYKKKDHRFKHEIEMGKRFLKDVDAFLEKMSDKEIVKERDVLWEKNWELENEIKKTTEWSIKRIGELELKIGQQALKIGQYLNCINLSFENENHRDAIIQYAESVRSQGNEKLCNEIYAKVREQQIKEGCTLDEETAENG